MHGQQEAHLAQAIIHLWCMDTSIAFCPVVDQSTYQNTNKIVINLQFNDKTLANQYQSTVVASLTNGGLD